jgi:hypothetical protein
VVSGKTTVGAEGIAGGKLRLLRERDGITVLFIRAAESMVFILMAVDSLDTFGGWHEDAIKVIVKLGRQVARGVGKEEGDTVNRSSSYQNLSELSHVQKS